MSDEAEQQQEQATGKRGEAAWKEARERVAERNAKARKLGKQRREAYERGRDEARRAAERRQMAEFGKRDTP
jgi:hypothetical protein